MQRKKANTTCKIHALQWRTVLRLVYHFGRTVGVVVSRAWHELAQVNVVPIQIFRGDFVSKT